MDNNNNNIKVVNMTSPRTGRPVANQFIIINHTTDTVSFQSYGTLICWINRQYRIYLDSQAWDYSRTTSKYLLRFLREYSIYKDITRKQAERYFEQGIFKKLK